VVERHFKGLRTSKIEGKFSLRMVQNADIELKDCFVPESNRLTHSYDFTTGLRELLMQSRISAGWASLGCQAGAYEACVKYCLERK